jgi:osmotically-inducible protein OsmY
MPSHRKSDPLALPGVPDAEIERALNDYVCRALRPSSGSVTVAYAAGVARLTGHVASAAQSTAVEDLVRWHDRVERVVNALEVVPHEAAIETTPRPT